MEIGSGPGVPRPIGGEGRSQAYLSWKEGTSRMYAWAMFSFGSGGSGVRTVDLLYDWRFLHEEYSLMTNTSHRF